MKSLTPSRILHAIAFLVILALSPVWSQTLSSLDSLELQLDHHTTEDTLKVERLNNLSDAYRKVLPHRAVFFSKQALELAKQLDHQEGVAASYRGLSGAYWAQGDYDKSLESAFAALEIFQTRNNLYDISRSYTMLGLIYDELGEYQRALSYHTQSKENFARLADSSGIANSLNNLGAIHYKQKNLEKALAHFKESLAIRLARQARRGISEAQNNIGMVYTDLGKTDSALVYLNSALRLKREINDINGTIVSLENLGAAYFKQGNLHEAQRHYLEALTLAQQSGIKKWQLEIYERLLALERQRGNAAIALDYYDKYTAVKDSLFNESKSRQIAELHTKYETEKKEREIALLQRDQRIRTLWQYILVTGLVASIGAAFLILRFYRFRSEKNRQLFEAQQVQTRQLQEVDKMKSAFFANISHEFRTPLTIILGLLDRQKERVEEHAARRDLTIMQRNAGRLLQLINQLLDLSKLDAGALQLRAARSDLARFLKQLVVSFASLAEQKNIELRFNGAPVAVTAHTPIVAYFDRDQMEKIITNLLSNAFKFTPEGGRVSVAAAVCDEQVELTVANTGPGIRADKLPHVFDRFYQIEEGNTREFEGSGIGLALVKELVALHHGEVSVKSVAGQETTFTVHLPLGHDHLTPQQIVDGNGQSQASKERQPTYIEQYSEPGSQSLAPTTDSSEASPEEIILVVEDHADLRDFICEHLREKYRVIAAGHGQEGLAKALEHVPDLVISDVMMPHMNGYELCATLKSNEATDHIPVILLTARAAQEDKLAGLETGADDYLTKPFDAEELKLRVRNLIQTRNRLREKFSSEMLLKPSQITVPSTHRAFLQRVTAVIENNLGDEELSVETLGEEVGLSRGQLHRKLRALTNQSPSQFIRSFRLQRAAELIRQEAGNLAEIAYRVGFSSQAYFTRCFREEFGCSPSEFRKDEFGVEG